MSNIFSGVSKFPKPDNWPWLYDKGQFTDPEYTILYAEHHNKLADFITKSEKSLLKGAADGDGSLKGLSYMFSLNVPIPTILKTFALNSYQSPTTSIPGNVLPFEFVFTENYFTNNYNPWSTSVGSQYSRGGSESVIVRGISQCAAVVQGLDLFTGDHMVSATIKPKTSVRSLTESLGYPWSSAQTYRNLFTNQWVETGTDSVGRRCLLVRGIIVNQGRGDDLTSDIDATGHQWMEACSGLTLSLRVMGVKLP